MTRNQAEYAQGLRALIYTRQPVYFCKKGACVAMAELTCEEQAKAAQRAYMRAYSQRPGVRERKKQANIDFWARRYAKMTEEEKRDSQKQLR